MIFVLLVLGWLAAFLLIWSWRKRRVSLLKDFLALSAYGLLAIAFFWQVIFLPNRQIPLGGGDLASFLYPVYAYAAKNLQSGVIPFWNPHLYGGSPFAADMQSGLFYPINLLTEFLARPFTYATMEGLVIFHYFLAACFMYIYARRLGLGRTSSFGAGIVFAFSGATVAHLGHLNMLAAVVWLPLILFFFHRAVTEGSLTAAVGAGAAYGISILAGHIQISLYLALFLALYWLWGLATKGRVRGKALQSRSGVCRLALSLPISFGVALGIAAIQLIPSFELVTLSVRSGLDYEKAVEFAASPLAFVTLLLPHFFGDNPAAFWGVEWSLTEVYGYVGILTLLLVGLGLLLRRRRLDWPWFFFGIALLFFLLSLGQYTILYGWLYKFVPGFDRVRAPGRMLLLFDFAVAVVAAYGLDNLTRPLNWRDRPLYRLFLWAVAITLVISLLVIAPIFYHALLTSQDKDPVIFERVALAIKSLNFAILLLASSLVLLFLHRYLQRRRFIISYLALAIIAFDLFSANVTLLRPSTDDVTIGFQHPEVVEYLREDNSPFRIDSVTGVWDVWQPNLSLLEGLDDIMGVYNPMLLADYDRYWANLGSRSVPAYDLLNAKYVVAHKDVTLDWAKFTPVLTDAPHVNVYENTRALPRAMVVPQAETLSRDSILERLRSADFGPRKTLLLEQEAPLASSDSQTELRYQILRFERPGPNEVLVEVSQNQSGYLLLSETAYPGWCVYVDGHQEAWLRADYIFQAVALSEGNHEVRFVYRPRFWEAALGLSAFTGLLCLGLGCYWASRFLIRRA